MKDTDSCTALFAWWKRVAASKRPNKYSFLEKVSVRYMCSTIEIIPRAETGENHVPPSQYCDVCLIADEWDWESVDYFYVWRCRYEIMGDVKERITENLDDQVGTYRSEHLMSLEGSSLKLVSPSHLFWIVRCPPRLTKMWRHPIFIISIWHVGFKGEQTLDSPLEIWGKWSNSSNYVCCPWKLRNEMVTFAKVSCGWRLIGGK